MISTDSKDRPAQRAASCSASGPPPRRAGRCAAPLPCCRRRRTPREAREAAGGLAGLSFSSGATPFTSPEKRLTPAPSDGSMRHAVASSWFPPQPPAVRLLDPTQTSAPALPARSMSLACWRASSSGATSRTAFPVAHLSGRPGQGLLQFVRVRDHHALAGSADPRSRSTTRSKNSGSKE